MTWATVATLTIFGLVILGDRKEPPFLRVAFGVWCLACAVFLWVEYLR